MPRKIQVVISDIINEIPKNELIELKKNLEDIIKNLIYSPPEVIESNHFWNELTGVINYHITSKDYNDENKPWIKKIINIFTDINYKNT